MRETDKEIGRLIEVDEEIGRLRESDSEEQIKSERGRD